MKKQIIIYFVLFLLISVQIFPICAQVIGYTDDQIWTKLTNGEDVLIIDMRSEESYLESHIPTAINIVFGSEYNDSLTQFVYSYEKSENIIYCSCDEGASARTLVTELTDRGQFGFYYMSDNFRDWIYDTVSGSNPGSVDMDENSSSSLNNNNNQNNTPTIVISDLLPVNLVLALIAVVIVLWKKKK